MRQKQTPTVVLPLLAAVLTIACGGGVKHLSLRDDRLPIEARRWLADAEDETAIAKARVVDAEMTLEKIENYRNTVVNALKDRWAGSRGGAEGLNAWKVFASYIDERVNLAGLTLKAAVTAEDLAQMRLTQARAETAMRYDLAVYELLPIAEKVEALRGEVAKSTKVVEAQRVKVEKSADEAWKAFHQFAQKGGNTDALWFTY